MVFLNDSEMYIQLFYNDLSDIMRCQNMVQGRFW